MIYIKVCTKFKKKVTAANKSFSSHPSNCADCQRSLGREPWGCGEPLWCCWGAWGVGRNYTWKWPLLLDPLNESLSTFYQKNKVKQLHHRNPIECLHLVNEGMKRGSLVQKSVVMWIENVLRSGDWYPGMPGNCPEGSLVPETPQLKLHRSPFTGKAIQSMGKQNIGLKHKQGLINPFELNLQVC